MKLVFQTVKAHNQNCLCGLVTTTACFLWFVFSRLEDMGTSWANWKCTEVYHLATSKYLSVSTQKFKQHGGIFQLVWVLSGLKNRYVPIGQIQNQVQATAVRVSLACRSFLQKLCGIWRKRSRAVAYYPSKNISNFKSNILAGWQPSG